MECWYCSCWVSIVDWDKVGQIVASWVISPLMGGIIAAAFLYFIKNSNCFKEDKVEATKNLFPLLIILIFLGFGPYIFKRY